MPFLSLGVLRVWQVMDQGRLLWAATATCRGFRSSIDVAQSTLSVGPGAAG
jgi:hypothetical protein